MRPITSCLNETIVNICDKIRDLEIVQKKIQQILPENLQSVAKVGSFNKGCLVLVVDDPVWALELRFLKMELSQKLRQAGLYNLASLDIKVVEPLVQTVKKIPNKKHSISKKAQTEILKAAQHCEDDALQRALKKLAGSDLLLQ